MSANRIRTILRKYADADIAEHSRRFFKSGRGEYAEGDRFLGIRVPVLRSLVRQNRDLPFKSATALLSSRYHEERLLALLWLVDRYRRSDQEEQAAIYRFYLDSTRYINNWDLVDSSADRIVGAWLENRAKQPIYDLAGSGDLWRRRIAIISTFWLIRRNRYSVTLRVSRMLLNDTEDLIHKATGWMLREIGKRDIRVETEFLAAHYKKMPRTMLRYAIEKFPARERKRYLAGLV